MNQVGLDPNKLTVLISYEWDSLPQVCYIANLLIEDGRFNVVFDGKRMSGPSLDWTIQALKNCDVVIMLITRKYLVNDNLQLEATLVEQSGKRVVVVLSEQGVETTSLIGSNRPHYDGTTQAKLEKSMAQIIHLELESIVSQLLQKQESTEEMKIEASSLSSVISLGQKIIRSTIQGGGYIPWRRSKLMMVGEGRAGKTSTVRSLLGQRFEASLESTKGARIAPHVTVERQEGIAGRSEMVQMGPREETPLMAVRLAVQDFFRDVSTDNRREYLPALPQQTSHFKWVEQPESNRLSHPFLDFGRSRRFKQDEQEGEQEAIKQFAINASLWAEAIKEKDDPKNPRITFSIWDYGGQEVFYALHHIFLTQYGVYCVVFDMTRMFSNQEQCLSLLKFWLSSIKMHADRAPIFLVGTHKDEIHEVEHHRTIDRILAERLKLEEYLLILGESEDEVLHFFPVDNTIGIEDPVIQQLCRKIYESVKTKEYVNMSVPLTLTRTLDSIMEKRLSQPYLRIEEAEEVAIRIGATQTVREMMDFFHELGVLCYFNSPESVNKYVILDPQWLVDAFTQIIRDTKLHKLNTVSYLESRDRYPDDWIELSARGIVSKRLLFDFWSNEGSDECREFLLNLMKNMNLLCDWNEPNERQENVERYLVPSLFEVDHKLSTSEGANVVAELCFQITFDPFLPHGLFPRLVAFSVAHSAKCDNPLSFIPEISRRRAVLSFERAIFLMECLNESDAIRVSVLDSNFFEAIRQPLVSMLQELCNTVMGNLKFEIQLLVNGDDGEEIAVKWEDMQHAKAQKSPAVIGRDVKTRAFRNIDMAKLISLTSNRTEHREELNAPFTPMEDLDKTKLTVMISYQWDSQNQAKYIRDYLLADGKFNVIMDVDRIRENIYEWMEWAVRTCDAMIMLVTKKYYMSGNCRREACYAAALNKKIVPIMLEPGYKGEKWLVMVISGFLYYESPSQTTLESNLRTIIDRELQTLDSDTVHGPEIDGNTQMKKFILQAVLGGLLVRLAYRQIRRLLF